ncbi:MAG TPA: hypothetical protein VEK11_15955 [Thermoanaerobaculia bacterium]|jgi:hypothetical protein|nr:hypothetical protein [Thermoanaerobaculia bacterium]
MKIWQRWIVAIPAAALCVAATQYAVRGLHGPSGSAGYLGTEAAGVEGIRGNTSAAVLGTSGSNSGALGAPFAGVTASGGTGVSSYGSSYGMYSQSPGVGIFGVGGTAGIHGIAAEGSSAPGIKGESPNGFAVMGVTVAGTGVYGELTTGGSGHAGYFNGRVHVNGTLSKSAGSFKIDHPLDPAGKYLSHSFVESPDMKNIYDGVVTLETGGTAVVELPEWFGVLNKDFRYQLTCIGAHAPVYISEEIENNRFRIAGGFEGMKVSWQVTGTRNDVYAQAHRIAVEEVKPPREYGRLLHPELYRAAPPLK